MDTAALKKFAPAARILLREQVSARLSQVLAEGSAARREAPNGVRELEGEISRTSRDQVVERVAYTWFNRFTALRFMDANGYTGTRVVSLADGQTRPEILSEAAAGVIGEEVPEAVAGQVRALLDNRTPSRDPQGEAYRLLLVAICNHWHSVMPFMFEQIADCTELLMPDDLLSANSLLARLRAVMTEDACQDVEVIGWLYQFYISEKKDEVFAGLKKNVKITPANIPAATQHWIVRYLVENSLGRLWLLNRPQSKLAERMDYYIASEQPETDFLQILRPEEFRICDPACGSGHMLTYAFDLLYAVYEEGGYEAAEIPALILAHNLYGIEIDDRAGALSAFALAMKVAAKLGRRRFLRLGVLPNICVMKDVRFTSAEMQDVDAVVGRDLFTDNLRETLGQFEQASNFGSLITPKIRDPAEVARAVRLKDFGGDLLLREVQERVLKVLEMAEALSPKYNVVVANPPYMGSGGMNGSLLEFAKSRYVEGKTDLFSMFMMRAISIAEHNSRIGMVNMQVWMFLSSYEALRVHVLTNTNITSLVQIGFNSFPELNSKVVQAVAFVLENSKETKNGIFVNLSDAPQSANKRDIYLSRVANRKIYIASREDFEAIPGAPIAYWVSEKVKRAFQGKLVGDYGITRRGLQSGDKERFVRYWFEPNGSAVDITSTDRNSFLRSESKWCRLNNGGPFRKWYGNLEFVINWLHDGAEIKANSNSIVASEQLYFKSAICWGKLSSIADSFRMHPAGVMPGDLASYYHTDEVAVSILFFNTKVSQYFKKLINPTLSNNVGDLARTPAWVNVTSSKELVDKSQFLVGAHKSDWDAYETSWDFATLPLLAPEHRATTLAESYENLRTHWRGLTEEMQRLEQENNRIFIDAYSLQDELTPEVPLGEITLTCNPAYRYRGKATEAELEERLLSDSMAEFLQYAVGCMFGRYSLEVPGLILANQGDGLGEYLAKVKNPSVAPPEANVIPMLEGDWFADDISQRFRQFLRVTFGEAHFHENLTVIEDALGKDIRKYFTRDFFNDHVQRYKKRPIYWLFSSPKGTFNALIYMHRYRPDTVSIVLNDYLRELRNKLEAHRRGQEALSISGEASQGQRTKALKEVDAIGKQIAELDAYERDVLFPLASRRIEIDLDDGVKANYQKFGDALKPIKGLAEADD
jgi:hypothetical protein